MKGTWDHSLGEEEIPWRREWQPTPVLPGKSHGQRGLANYSPWSHVESDITERLHFTFQYCQENPVDRGVWWATVHEVAKSRIY